MSSWTLGIVAAVGLSLGVAQAQEPPSATVGGVPVEIAITSHVDGQGLSGTTAVMVAEGRLGAEAVAEDGTAALALVIDVSCSAYFDSEGDCGGDVDGDGVADTVFDCEVAAAQALLEEANTAGILDEVGVSFLARYAYAADVSPSTGQQWLTTPDADDDENLVLDVMDVVASMHRAAGPTIYQPFAGPSLFTVINADGWQGGSSIHGGVMRACEILALSSAADRRVVVLTDGRNNRTPLMVDVAPCEPNAPVTIFSIGEDATCEWGSNSWGSMNQLAALTGGACYLLPDATDLPDVLPQLVRPEVTAATLTVDSGTPIDLATYASPALPSEGFDTVTFTYELTGITSGTEVCFEMEVEVLEDVVVVEDCVTLHENYAPVADIDGPLFVEEGSFVQLDASGSGDANQDPLTYAWQVQRLEGMELPLGTMGEATLAFPTLDEGRYLATVVVSDGVDSDVAEVEVVVENADPVALLQVHDGLAGGIATLAGQIRDFGPLDAAVVTITWGDGSEESFHPSTSGPGWAALVSSHAYAEPGAYTIDVVVDDQDGGLWLGGAEATASAPVAVWAGNTSLHKAFDWSGCGGEIVGAVHSNGDLWVGGGGKSVDGPVTLVGTLKQRGDVSFTTAPAGGVVSASPVSWEASDYGPEGSRGQAYAANLHDHTGACVDGVWTATGVLADGVHYADCDMVIDVAAAKATFAATGTIRVVQEGAQLEAYTDGVALMSGASDDFAVSVEADDVTVFGYLVAKQGGVSVGGASLTLACGVVGDRVDLVGSGLSLDASSCTTSGPAQLLPIVIPELSLAVVTDLEDLLPGQAVTATSTVSFDGVSLLVPGVLGVQNLGVASVTALGVDVTVSARPDSQSAWQSLSLATTTQVTRLPVPGGLSGDLGAGPVVISAGAGGYWTVETALVASGQDLDDLLAASVGGEVRFEVGLDLDNPTSEPVRVVSHASGLDLSAASAGIEDVEIVVLGVDGVARTLDADDDVALGLLVAGGSVSLGVVAEPSVLAAKASGESSEAYLERLRLRDEARVPTAAYATGRFNDEAVLGALIAAEGTLHVPYVPLDAEGGSWEEETFAVGDTLDLSVFLRNPSSATADALALTQTFGGAGVSYAGLPASLLASEWAYDLASVQVGEGLAGSNPTIATELSWEDEEGNAYGPISTLAVLTVAALPSLRASLTDSLYDDVDLNGGVTPGDVVELELVVRTGGASVDDVELSLPIDADVTYVTGSAASTAGTVTVDTSGASPVVLVDVGTVAASTTVTVTARVEVPSTGAPAYATHQASVASASLATFWSDDPAVPGHEDATTTPVLSTDAEPYAMLVAFVTDDADGNGYPSPGDRVHFEALVANVGAGSYPDATLEVPYPELATVVSGSVDAGTGTLLDGGDPGDLALVVDLGDLGAGEQGTAGFDVVLGLGSNLVGSIETQGDVTSSDGPAIVTDDPGQEGEDQATVVPVGDPPYPDHGDNYTGPFPTADLLSPSDGDRITVPTAVLGTLSATEGEEIQGWRVVLRKGGSSAPEDRIDLAFELGAPQSGELAEIDPTVLENGVYVLEVSVLDTSGLLGWTEVQVFVDGSYKPGRHVVSMTDVTVETPVGEVAVRRVYDTLAKDVVGDFGNGWRLETSSVRVQTNGPLGYRGWSKSECGSQMFGTSMCWVTAKPHVVAVTWPDGRQDVWDFTPKANTWFIGFLMEPAFTARANTRGELAVDPTWTGTTGYFDSATGNLYGGMSGNHGLYEPPRYILTQPDGTKLWLSPARGLERVEDRFGNWTTFDDDGIRSSQGAQVLFDRDEAGRIVQVTRPDGELVTYTYAQGGELAQAVDPASQPVEYAYDTGHRLLSYGRPGETPTSTLTYDLDGRLMAQQDATGVTVTQEHDLDLLTLTEVGPDPALTTLTTFDEDGNVGSIEQSFGTESYVTTFTYDTGFRPIEVELPSGGTEFFDYDAQGRLLSHTDAAGVTTTTTYGLYDQPIGTSVGGIPTEVLVQDSVTGLIEERRRGNGDLVQALTYDALGRPVSVTNGENETTTISYGPSGYPDVVTLPGNRVVTLTFNALGQQKTVTRPDGGTRVYDYDERGLLTALTDPDGESQLFYYDAQGRLEAYLGKGPGGSVEYTYDDAGRLLTRTDREDVTVSYSYDAAGRLEEEEGPDVVRTFTYDALGRMLTASTGTHTLTWTHDEAGVLTQTASGSAPYATKTFTWTRDLAGRPDTLDGPGGLVTYGFDTLGRLGSLDHEDLGAFILGWDASFRPTTLSRPNGAVTTTSYDDADRVTSLLTQVATTTVHSLGYAYDTRGYPSSMTTSSGTHSFTHDVLGRLTAADHPSGSGLTDEAYSYDSAFSRTSWTNASGEHDVSEVEYDEGDRLVQDLLFTYAYDAEGRRISRTGRISQDVTSYAWDSLGQLVEVEEPDGDVWGFDYDALGRRTLVERVPVSGPSETWTFVYDDQGLVRGVYDDAGAVVAEYVTGFGFGEVLAELRPDGQSGTDAFYAVRDKLGSPVAWLDEAGAIAEEVARDAYGNRTAAVSAPVPYGYTGHAEDPTGLVWGRARYLEPGTGGWLSEDPVWGEPRTGYVWGAPTRSWDEDGRMAAETSVQSTASTTFAYCAGGFGTTALGMVVAVAAFDANMSAWDAGLDLAVGTAVGCVWQFAPRGAGGAGKGPRGGRGPAGPDDPTDPGWFQPGSPRNPGGGRY